jgi:hypothetical protein
MPEAGCAWREAQAELLDGHPEESGRNEMAELMHNHHQAQDKDEGKKVHRERIPLSILATGFPAPRD